LVILGGGGFIGRHFLEAVGAHGSEVLVVDSNPPRAVLRPGVTFHRRDIRDPGAFDGLLEPGDRVLHLAAAHHDFGLTRATFFAVNAWGSEVLARAASAAGVKDICFLSSVAVYGSGGGTHAETDPCVPQSDYGASKLAAEQVLTRWAEGGAGRRLLIIRPAMIFGEHNFANMYSLISQLASGLYLSVGPGRNRKSIGYVGNLVPATLGLWGREDRAAVEVFNFADKPDLTSRQIEATISRTLGSRLPRLRVPLGMARILAAPFDAVTALTGRDLGISFERVRKFAVDETIYDCTKLLKSGFVPEWTLEEAVARTVAWYVQEGKALEREVRRPLPRADDETSASQWLLPSTEQVATGRAA